MPAAAQIEPGRWEVARLVAGYGAIASALPYLALKMTWLTGRDLGVIDRRVIEDPGMISRNAVTAGFDVVAIAVALAERRRYRAAR
jgi:hypothetical protein